MNEFPNSQPTLYYPENNNNNNNVPIGGSARHYTLNNSNKNSAYGNGLAPTRRNTRANLAARRAAHLENLMTRISNQEKSLKKAHANLNKERQSRFFRNRKTIARLERIYASEKAKMQNLRKQLELFQKRPELLMKWHAAANAVKMPIHRRVAGKLPPTPSAAARKVWRGVAATVTPEQTPLPNIVFSPRNMAQLTGLSENYIKKVNQIFGSNIPVRNKETILSLKKNLLKSAANMENYRKSAERFRITGVARIVMNGGAAAAGSSPIGIYQTGRANMQIRNKQTRESFNRSKQAYLNYVTGSRFRTLAQFKGITL